MTRSPANSNSQSAGAQHVVFFDGVCGFCDWIVRWLVARDPQARLHFAPLQGETAASFRSAYPAFPRELNTLVYADCTGDPAQIEVRSRAVFRILRLLPGPVRHLAHLEILPRALTDLGYRALAATRYQLFGRLEECAVPTPELRRRFLV